MSFCSNISFIALTNFDPVFMLAVGKDKKNSQYWNEPAILAVSPLPHSLVVTVFVLQNSFVPG